MPKIIFITGVCGSGKSSLIPYLKVRLSQKQFDVHDFDERGVPDGVDREWRLDETKHWLDLGAINAKRGISTIITGFSKPDEIRDVLSNNNIEVLFCLLDTSPNVIRKRLGGRYITEESQEEIKRVSGDTPKKFIEDNALYASELRKLCKDWDGHIINTDNLNPEEVATDIVDWVKKMS